MINQELLKNKKFSCSSGLTGEQNTVEFNLPLKSGDNGLSVLCLSHFLGVAPTTVFNRELKEALTDWQTSNFESICQIAGWINPSFQGSIDDIPQFEFEVGSLNPATFVAIKIAGRGPFMLKDLNENYAGYVVKKGDYLIKIARMFGFSLEEIEEANPQIEDPNKIRVDESIILPDVEVVVETAVESVNIYNAIDLSFDTLAASQAENLATSPDRDLVVNIPLSDTTNEPHRDSNYYYAIWNSRTTRSQLSTSLSEFIRQNSSTALRQGVRSLFDFYSKKTTWEIDLRTEAGNKFSELLVVQGRMQENENTYQLSIDNVPVLEALGLNNTEAERRVDALSFQDLTEGATPQFASIAKVVMPELKQRSTFKFIVKVKAEMFDAIPTDLKPVSEQKSASSSLKNASACSDEEFLSIYSDVDGNVGDFENVRNRVKNQRELAKLKKIAGITKDPEIIQQVQEKLSQINLRELADFKEKLDALPLVVSYKISTLEKNLKSVQAFMNDYDKLLVDIKKFGVTMSPDVSLRDESQNLSGVLSAIKKVSDYNNVEISTNNRDNLLVSYRVIRSSTDDIETIEGLEVKSISVQKEENSETSVFSAGVANFLKSSPISSRTTMTYFAMLNILTKQAARHRSKKVQNIEPDRAEVLAFPMAFHFPKPEYDFTSVDLDFNTSFGSTLEDFDYSVNKIKNYAKNIDLNFNLSNNLGIFDKIKFKTFEIEKFREFVITDRLPVNINFGSLDELFTEFFDRYDMLSLFVDFGQMVPDFEVCEPNWDFDFSIPTLPRMPSFDPIEFIVKMLERALQELLLSILSAVVRMILKFLSNNVSPATGLEDLARNVNVNDIFSDEGAFDSFPGFENFDLPKGFSDFTERGFVGSPGIANRMRAAGKRLGLTESAIAELATVFETITNVCTPQEISDLLDGVASPEVNEIVLNVIKNTCGNLSKKVNDVSDVIKVTKSIGDFVNPSIKDKLKNFGFAPPIVEANIPCPDDIGSGNSDSQIRNTLEKLDASPEEVERAVADARKRRDSIKNFFTKNPINSQMPGGPNGLAGLPSPYENENMDRLTELAAKGVFGSVEAVFVNEVAGFVPLLFEMQTRPLTEQDPDYDHVGMAEFFFVKNQIDQLDSNTTAENFPLIEKPGKVYFRNYDNQARDANGNLLDLDTRRQLPGSSNIVQEVIAAEELVRNEGGDLVRDDDGNPVNRVAVFNLADRNDSNLLQQIMMKPMNNTRQSLQVFSTFFRYLGDTRTNFVGFREYPEDNSRKSGLEYLIKDTVSNVYGFQNNFRTFKDFNVRLVDKPYYTTPVDCYELERPARIFENREQEALQTFSYNDDISPEMDNIIRRRSGDKPKLLRPEAFFELVSDAVNETYTASKDRRTDFVNQGIYAYTSGKIVDDFNQYADRRAEGVNLPIYKVLYPNVENNSEDPKGFDMLMQHFMDGIAGSIRKSKFFNRQELDLLSEKVSSKYIEDFSNGIRCLKKVKGVIDFEDIRKSALKDYKESLKKEEYNPINRDFSKPGPMEESFADQLIMLYIKSFIVEFALKSLFISSRVSLTYMLGQTMVYDFFVDYMVKTLEREFGNSNRYRINFYQQIKKIANLDDEKEALNSLVAKQFESTEEEVRKISEELFESRYSSYQEEYFNSLVNNSTSVPGIPSLRYRNYLQTGDNTNQVSQQSVGWYLRAEDSVYLGAGEVSVYDVDDVATRSGNESISGNPNITLDLIREEELRKNSGFFKLEYYFQIDNPDPSDKNYVAKALGFAKQDNGSLGDHFFMYYNSPTNDGKNPQYLEGYGIDFLEYQGVQVGVNILHESVERASSKRMSVAEMSKTMDIAYNSFVNRPRIINNTDGVERVNPYKLILENVKIGIRLVYVTGRGDVNYENFLYNEGPTSLSQALVEPLSLLGMPGVSGASLAAGRNFDALEFISKLNNLNWVSFFDPSATPVNSATIGISNEKPFIHQLMTSMKVGPVRFVDHVKERAIEELKLKNEELSSNADAILNLSTTTNNYIELASHEIAIDCAEDLFINAGGRRTEFGNVLLDSFKDKLLEGFLGLGPSENGVRKLNKEAITDSRIKLLFNDIFPLDRLASMYFINEHSFFDISPKFNDLLGGTRGAIRSTYRILKNKGTDKSQSQNTSGLGSGTGTFEQSSGDFGIGDKSQVPPEDSYSVINSNMTANGPGGDMAGELMGDLIAQIPKMVAQTPITMIRGLASSLDPAYADMSRISNEDPCRLRDGAGIGSVLPPIYTFPGRTINGGIKGDRYVPVTLGAPVDIGLSSLLMSNIFTFPFGVRGMINSVTHTLNAVSPAGSTGKSYGKPITPLGLLALGLPHMPGENPAKKKREAGCDAPEGTNEVYRDVRGNVLNGNGRQELQRCEDEEE